MRTVKLIPTTNHGRNRIREAGTDLWTVEDEWEHVQALRGPGLFLIPSTGDWTHARWVHKEGGHFDVQHQG